MGDKLKEGVTPDSQKSMLDKTKESATDTYDKAASSVQPSTLLPQEPHAPQPIDPSAKS